MSNNEVTLTAALRSNLLSLQGTQRLLDQTQLRLATGKKINSALDNANAFFASQSLSFRAGDLGNLLDGIGQGIQAIKAADKAITSLTQLLNQAQAIAQGARDGVGSSGGSNGQFTAESTNTFDSAEAADLVAATVVGNGDVMFLNFGGVPGTLSLTIGADDSLQDIVDKINAQSTAAGIGEIAEVVPDPATFEWRIDITANVEVTFSGADGVHTALGLVDITDADLPPGTLSGIPALEADFNTVIAQIDGLIADANYRGVNLLNSSDLEVRFNEDGTSSLLIDGVDFTAVGFGIGPANFTTTQNIDDMLETVRGALDMVRAQARSFGTSLTIMQTREDFTKNLISTLKEGSDKLTLADTNEEAAKLLSLQTAQQLGITSLSLASQAQQGVLRLF